MVVSRPTRAPRARFDTLDYAMGLEEAIVLPLVRRPAPRPLPTIVDKRGLVATFEREHPLLRPSAPRVVPRLQSLVAACEIERQRPRPRRWRAFAFAMFAAFAAGVACAFMSGRLVL